MVRVLIVGLRNCAGPYADVRKFMQGAIVAEQERGDSCHVEHIQGMRRYGNFCCSSIYELRCHSVCSLLTERLKLSHFHSVTVCLVWL